jgi:hypothetical protein
VWCTAKVQFSCRASWRRPSRWRLHGSDIVGTQGFRPAGNETARASHFEKLGAALPGQCLFGRIGDLDDVPGHTGICDARKAVPDLVERVVEVADQHRTGVLGQLHGRRQGLVVQRVTCST